MDITELKQILFNVNHLCSHIERSRIEVKKLNYHEYTHVFVDVHRLLDIFICSLIDELKVFEKFVKKEDNYYLSDTLYALTPLTNYIKKFDSLRVKRNKILAHHNRDKKKSFTPWWKELKGKRFATTHDEERMIFSTVSCIHQLFVKRFPKELKEVLEEYDEEINEYEKQMLAVPDVQSLVDIAPTIKEVQKRMKEKEFTFTIASRK